MIALAHIAHDFELDQKIHLLAIFVLLDNFVAHNALNQNAKQFDIK